MAFLQNERVRWLLTACVVVLSVVFVLQLRPRSASEGDATALLKASALSTPLDVAAPSAAPTTALQVAVDVIGAVQQPGVYYLDATARVADVVTAAGGLAPDAARDQINLAAPLVDGSQIRVPYVGELEALGTIASSAAAPGLVNINSADAALLDTLPGTGPALAQAIIDERTRSGAFKQIEDLQNVPGIGPALFAKIKGSITI